MSRWDNLSMKDKSDLIRMYVKSGIRDIDSIKSHYNKFEDGGPKTSFSDTDYRPDPHKIFKDAREFLDPTGVSSWINEEGSLRQAVKSYKSGEGSLNNIMFEALNAIPLIGYTGKTIKLATGKTRSSNIDEYNKTVDIIHKEAPKGIDYEELKRRQAWTESKFNDNAKSPAGASGRFQIMPVVQKEYEAETGKKGNILDPKYNEEVRDWYFNERIPKSQFINKGNPTDSVKVAKQLASYNYGATNTIKVLEKAKKAGVDIYQSLDWIDYLPKETRDYINFILLHKNTGSHRNDSIYNANKDKY